MKRIFAFLLVAILFVSSAAIWSHVQDDWKNISWERHVVESGDTLWTIAQESNVNNDKSDVIAVMQDYNNIKNASIRPGDVVYYPVKK